MGCSALVGAGPCEVQDVGGRSRSRPGPEIQLLGPAQGPFLGLGAPSPRGALQGAHN